MMMDGKGIVLAATQLSIRRGLRGRLPLVTGSDGRRTPHTLETLQTQGALHFAGKLDAM